MASFSLDAPEITPESIESAVAAHKIKICGVIALPHDLDSAVSLLEQSYAILVSLSDSIDVGEDRTLPLPIVEAALRGAETLLEHGIRDLITGHEALLRASRKASGQA
jgi:hypothetical protein